MRKLLSSVIVLALLFNLFCIPVGAVEGAAYTVWVPSNSEKVLLDQLPPSEINNVVDIKSARNEYEGAQVIIHAGDSDLENVSVTISDLTDGNNTISYGNIGIFRECYINVTQSSTEGLLPGWYPDALVPLTGEFSIPANKNQGIWFSVKVPKGFPSGQYSGSISISGAGINETIPVNLTVWDFELTDENHYQSCFQIWFSQMLSQYPGITDPNSPEAWAMYKNYYDFMIDHRLAPSSLPVDEEEGRTDIQSYIDKIRPYIEDPRISAYAIPYYMKSDGSFDNKSTTNLVRALNDAGLLSKGYFYVIDEPDLNSSQDIQRIKDLGNYVKALDDLDGIKVKNVVTSTIGVVDSLSEYVNTWCPDYGCFTSQSQWDKVDARHEAGDSVWWYGCCWPRYPFPTYHIDDFMQGTRILSWMQKYHNIDGQLYWSVDIFKKYVNGAYIPRDVWNDPVAFVGGLERPVNGDGFLLYPGPDGPYSTLRLEAIRDGNEDYEYLWLLDQLVAQTNEKLGSSITSKDLLKDVYDMLFSDINNYTKNPEYIKIAREQVANTIMSLSKDPSGLVLLGNTTENKTKVYVYTGKNTVVKVNGADVTGTASGDNAVLCTTEIDTNSGINSMNIEYSENGVTNLVTRQFIPEAVGYNPDGSGGTDPGEPSGTVENLIKTSSQITIDGDFTESDWNLGHTLQYGINNTDNRANVGVLWDENNLYVAYDVTDNILINANSMSWGTPAPFCDDSVELYIDGDMEKGAYTQHTVQYVFRWNDPDNVYKYGNINATTSSISFVMKQNDTNTGYRMEAAIPWSAIGGMDAPSTGSNIRLTFHVNDKDVDSDSDTLVSTLTYTNNGSSDWETSANWADFILIPNLSNLTDSEAVGYAADELTFNAIKNMNTSWDAVNSNLNLITRNDLYGVDISWSSSLPDVIAADGTVKGVGDDTAVTLTATLVKGTETITKTIEVIVKRVVLTRKGLADIFSDDCSNFSASWELWRANNENVYITDGSDSYSGKYVIYGDASDNSTTVTAAKPGINIGEGPWYLDFDAKIESLQTPEKNAGWRGLTIDVNTTQREYRVSFNSTTSDGKMKIYIRKSDSVFDMAQVNLPSDDGFHKWTLAADGAGGLVVSLDGNPVADFRDITLAGSSSEQITINNDMCDSDGSSGNTVYIDNIIMGTSFNVTNCNYQLASIGSSVNVTADTNLEDSDVQSGSFKIKAGLYKDGILVAENLAPVISTGTASISIPNVNQTGLMKLVVDLLYENIKIAQIVKDVDITFSQVELDPGQTVSAESGTYYIFNKVNQMKGNDGSSIENNGWSMAAYTVNNSNDSGIIIESGDNANALTLPVTLNGWLGVYIGYVNGTQEFSVSDGNNIEPVTVSYFNFNKDNLYGNQVINETFAFAANFNNNTVKIIPTAGKNVRIAYIKLVGLTDQQVQLYQKPDEGTDSNRLIIDNDGFTDFFYGKYPTVEALKGIGIDRMVDQAGIGELNWCLGTTGMLNYNSQYAGNAFAGSEEFEEQLREGDKLARQQILNILASGKSPLEILAQRGKELGVKVDASLRMEAFYDPDVDGLFNGSIFDTLVNEECLQNGSEYLMSYNSPYFRNYILNILKEASSFEGVDGVTLDFARYPWVIGNEVPTLDGKKAVMTQFMRDVRSALEGKNITVRVPYNEWQTYGLDIETWVAEGLIDRLIPSVRSYEDFYDIQPYIDMVKETDVQLYIGITADLSGSDLTKEQEQLMKEGKYVPNNRYLSMGQYLSRTYEAYKAGADGVFLFNTLNDVFFLTSISPKYKLLGDNVKMEKWHEFEYPAEQVQSTITIIPVDSVFYDNCSSLADAGWEARYKQNVNLFVGDNSQSTVYQRVIPEGQYMFYADATDNDTSAISKPLDIGAGPLCLEFNAKFKNLQTPGKNEGWRGFVLEIAANGKDYRLALNSMDPAGNAKIYIRKNDDNEFLVKDVTLPTDDNFHRWSISCDDNGGVTVFIDNKPVALFTGITLTGGSDALYIYNDMSDRSTGNNEIYIDNINLRKPAEADYSGYIALAMEALTFNKIKNSNTDAANIISDLSLPSSDSEAGVTISWSSSNTNVIDNNGKVTRPASNSQDTSVTLTATFTKGSSMDSRIFNLVVKKMWSDNGSPTSPISPTSDSGSATPLTIVDGTVKVETKLQSGGIAAADINTEDLDKAFKQVTTDVNGVKQVKIELKAVEGSKLYIQRLPSSAVASGNKNEKIEIKTSLGTIVVPGNMFNSNDVKQVPNIGIAIGLADKSNIDKTLMKKIGNKPVVEINASADGKTIAWNNPDAPVKVSVDYSPTAEELKDPEHIVVWYIDGEGKVVAVPDGRYDNTTGKVTFTTTHFSKYAVAFVHKTFSDITGCEWARKQIEVLASKGVINGTTETTYEPDMSITRADFLVLLVKTLGLTAKVESNFDDVEKNAYYYETVGIAKKLGITSGVGGNKFNPNDPILRQDMMTLVAKALKVAGKAAVTGGISDLTGFSDASIISPYAVESVAALVKEGIIQGSGNMINPFGNTTRAEVAVLVYRLYYK